MTPYEYIELLDKEYEPSEVVEIANDFISEIEGDPKQYIVKLSEEIEDYARTRGICSLCGSELVTATHYEDRGEYLGFECSEPMYVTECSNGSCSYTQE